MPTESVFADASQYRPAATVEYHGVTLPLHFTNSGDEYRVACEAAALFDRSDRGLLGVMGDERQNWLHNLVTNQVRNLAPRTGNYAFATDVRGRLLFDLNILCLPHALWLDIDNRQRADALAHLEKYLISEPVELGDITKSYARLGVAGPLAAGIADRLGRGNFAAMPALASHPLQADEHAQLVRHDFAGLPGFELIVPAQDAAGWWERLARDLGAVPAGLTALDALRIEAGIPWSGRDLDEQVIPPETGQIERGISYNKGCYLGQEIIERMRSHGSRARRLVKVRLDTSAAAATAPQALEVGGKEAGRLTSVVQHPIRDEAVGLAYVKTNITDTSDLRTRESTHKVAIVGPVGD